MALVGTLGNKVNFAKYSRRIAGVKKYTKNKGAEGNADVKEKIFILEELSGNSLLVLAQYVERMKRKILE